MLPHAPTDNGNIIEAVERRLQLKSDIHIEFRGTVKISMQNLNDLRDNREFFEYLATLSEDVGLELISAETY